MNLTDWITSERLKFAVISATADGDNTLVAAQGAGRKIRVVAFSLSSAQAGIRIFQSGAGGTEIGRVNVAAAGDTKWEGPTPCFETADNALLNLVNEAGDDTQGWIVYVVTD